MIYKFQTRRKNDAGRDILHENDQKIIGDISAKLEMGDQ